MFFLIPNSSAPSLWLFGLSTDTQQREQKAGFYWANAQTKQQYGQTPPEENYKEIYILMEF